MAPRTDIRFGTIAVEKGFISPCQLGKAVCFQMKLDLEKGIHRLLGDVLVDRGFMTSSQVEEVLQARNRPV